MFSQKLKPIPTFIEMLDELSKLSQSARAHIFEVDCLFSNGLDGVMVKSIYYSFQIWQSFQDVSHSFSVYSRILKIFNSVESLVYSVGVK